MKTSKIKCLKAVLFYPQFLSFFVQNLSFKSHKFTTFLLQCCKENEIFLLINSPDLSFHFVSLMLTQD